MDYKNKLNDAQYEAVITTEGPVIVSAGAGSGKTRVLTFRVAYLLTELHVNPQNIVAITFTNKAANEMKERIEKFEPNGKYVNVSTIHSLCARLLRMYISYLPEYKDNFSIYTDKEQNQVFKKVFTEMNIDKSEEGLKDSILSHFNKIKNSCLNIDEYCSIHKYYKEMPYVKIFYDKYQKELISNNAMDFDDLLINMYKLLKSSEEVRETIQRKIKYLLVDEFQDTNTLQYETLKLMTGKNKNIFVVGDEDQSIYSWRGANSDIMLQFIKDFKDAKIIKLEKNYRSTKAILNKANDIIKNNQNRLDKKLFTDNESGDDVEFYSAYEDGDEADYVARHIYMLHNQGIPYNQIAILTRLNALTRPFEDKLRLLNIPYIMYNGFKFYDRAEVKSCLAYLTAVVNPSDNNNLMKIINFPKRGIGETSILKLQQLADAQKCSLKEIILNARNLDIKSNLKSKLEGLANLLIEFDKKSKEVNVYELIKYVVEEAKILESFNEKDEEDYNRQMNVITLVESIREYVSLNPEATVIDYLQTVSLTAKIDEEDGKDGVIIATVHGAKGLEFDTVFIIGLEEKMFPISRSGDTDLEEERRLMYVAITRAKRKLYLTNAKSRYMYGKREMTVPSRFLKELDFIRDKKFDYISPYGDYANSENYNSFSPKKYQSNVEYSKNASSSRISNINNYSTNNFQTIPKKVDINSISGVSKGIQKRDIDDNKVKVGAMVSHPKFGTGVISSISDYHKNRCVIIDFELFGKKSLSLDFAPITFVDKI